MRNGGTRGLVASAIEIFREERRLLADTLLLGVVGALAAQVFTWLLRGAQFVFLQAGAGYRPASAPGEGLAVSELIGSHGLWLIPLITTVGGLLSGILVYAFAPEAEGHGTDTVVSAFHRAGGFIRARVAPVKMLASAITIGSGGAAGREGPTALIAAGVGASYATLTRRTEADRRLLGLIGMAAGLSAIFRSPIGTALFAVEVLYGGMEFEGGALLYTMIASVVAYAVNGLFSGWEPLFGISQSLPVPSAVDGLSYVVLGVVAGVVGALLPTVFYRIRDAFRALPLPTMLKPAVGGLGVGLLGLWLPQVLGGGYGWIQLAIDGRMAVSVMLMLAIAKTVAMALTVSSGGSGGVFAPSLFVGAMVGGVLAALFHAAPAAMVIVGMAAVFGAAARVPLATLLMVTEMTGGYRLLVPAALAVMLSFLVQKILTARSRYGSLYEAQVASEADSPAHRLDYLSIAMRLIEQRGSKVPESVGHVRLQTLLASGIPVDLPDGKRLMLRAVVRGSPLAGRRLGSLVPQAKASEVEIAAIFRDEHTLLPHADLVLAPKDRLLLIASPAALQSLSSLFGAPLPVAGEPFDRVGVGLTPPGTPG
ncbi:MAG: chloride channel protein [Acidobacteriota bacterium]